MGLSSLWLALLALLATASGLVIEALTERPEGCEHPVCVLRVTTQERQLISCYVDAVFSAGGIADFTRHGHGPAVVASHCGSFVAIDHLPNIDYRADKWAPTAVAGGWSEELNARVPNGRRFVVLQLAMAEGSRVSGMLVMTVAGLTSGTVSKKFCCGCDPHGDGEKEL